MAESRPTIREISRLAGVSKATVDRVLNKRPGVQRHTRHHVMSVIDQFAGSQIADKKASTPSRQLDFIIPDHDNAFLGEMARYAERCADENAGLTITIHRPASARENDILRSLQAIMDTTEALGIVGLDSHRLRESIRSLDDRNIPVVTLASDIRNAPRTAYVGIDNHAAGRLAGYLAGRMLAKPLGQTALILGSRAYFGHEEREMGYRSVMRDQYPKMRIVDEREIHEDTDIAYGETRKILDQHPDLDGIYCIGAGQRGVAQALIDADRAKSVWFIAHGLSDDTRQWLIDGVLDVIIDESAAREAQAAVDALVARLDHNPALSRQAIPIVPIFRENLPVTL